MNNRLIYPSWHDKPLWLAVDEISNPMAILEDFCFELYNPAMLTIILAMLTTLGLWSVL